MSFKGHTANSFSGFVSGQTWHIALMGVNEPGDHLEMGSHCPLQALAGTNDLGHLSNTHAMTE